MTPESPPATAAATTLGLRLVRSGIVWCRCLGGLRLRRPTGSRDGTFTAATPSATAAATSAARLRRLLLLLLLRLLLLFFLVPGLLLFLRTLLSLRAAALVPLPIPLAPALRLRAAFALRLPLLRRSRTFVVATAAGPLLEFLHLLLHEPAALRFPLLQERVVTAVRTPLPPFGVRAIAVRTENAFR